MTNTRNADQRKVVYRPPTYRMKDFCSDTTAPEITFCPCNVFVQAASCASSATASWDASTATDASEPITAVSNFSPGDSFDVSTYLVIYYLIDNASFYSTCSFKVTVTSSGVVIDREKPRPDQLFNRHRRKQLPALVPRPRWFYAGSCGIRQLRTPFPDGQSTTRQFHCCWIY
ncbi:uncharacterized protein LOC105438450 [Strongylocentrotus purpuratus]|uniref:HYR domain-containing protein n=1 Tax=Strongylocentrotus purpuratus TaxID=7668 RepID=A0A7M7NQL9_STRPU|nr:uncharacterized protein LOC105438450 [Strongylocentrotus purpuratus]